MLSLDAQKGAYDPPPIGTDDMARILLAEDDDSLRGFLKRTLEKSGHYVDAVADGDAAATQADKAPYDLLLTDIVMPGLDGIALAQRMAARAPDTKVMFITGFAAVTMRAGREMPGARVLSKPFHLNDLVIEVQRVLATENAHGRL